MARPYDLYLRFLVTKGYTEAAEINGLLKDLSLPSVEQKHIDPIVDFVMDSIPDCVARQIESKQYEGDFPRYMKILEVWELWQIEREFRMPEKASNKLAYDIHYEPMLRLTVQALILKGQPHFDSCQELNSRYSYMLKPEHLELFSKFFWNPGRMTRRDWKGYLSLCSDFEKSVLFMALSDNLASVKAYLGLNTKADIAGSYHKFFNMCVKKIEFYSRMETKEANTESRSWLNTLMELGDKIKKHDSGDITDFSKTLQMAFEFVETDFPTPDQVTLQEIHAQQQKVEKNTDD